MNLREMKVVKNMVDHAGMPESFSLADLQDQKDRGFKEANIKQFNEDFFGEIKPRAKIGKRMERCMTGKTQEILMESHE
jgi:hypothetical protein